MKPPVTSRTAPASLLRKLRWTLGLFILALVLSGITAFPLQAELEQIAAWRGIEHLSPVQTSNGADRWILTIRDGLRESYARHPWLAYGTDWLAFAHLVIALFFVGAWRDPLRNLWILQSGVAACLLIIPLALVAGAVRQIPLGWRVMDCSFGVFGVIPLLYCLSWTRALASNLGRSGDTP